MSIDSLLILTGHRKAGTSLLHRLLDGVKSLNCYPVDISILYGYFPHYVNDMQLSDTQLKKRLKLVIEKSLEYLCTHNGDAIDISKFMKILDMEISRINFRSKFDVINAIYQTWSCYRGAQERNLPFLFKETSQSIYFSDFKNLYPDVKMISVIRDPRDNFAAIYDGIEFYYSKMGEGILESLSSFINRCRMDMMSAKFNMENYPERFLAVRYEDLIQNPRDTMQKIAVFVGIEFSDVMLNPTVMGAEYYGNSHDKKPRTGISSASIGAWETRLPEENSKVIEYWLKNEMKQWGYSTQFNEKLSSAALIKFYEQYNHLYFYNDSFDDGTQ